MMRTIKNLIGAVFIASAALIFWIFIMPNFDKMNYLDTAIQSRSVLFESKNALIQKANKLDAEYQSKYGELKRLALVVPSKDHVEEMITIIQNVFSKSGVGLENMAVSAKGNSGLAYNKVSMEFKFATSYEQMLNFLNTVEKSIRLIDVAQINLGVSQDSKNKNPVVLDVRIQADAYFVDKTVEEAAVGVPKTAAPRKISEE